MTLRDRIIAAAVVSAIHLLALGFVIGDPSNILDGAFQQQAEAILDGALPYADRGYEYPPLSLPLVLGPGLISDAEDSYRAAFGWEMMAFDLSIVLMLSLALRGESRRIWGALAVYTVGVVGLSGVGPLPDSDLEAQPLGLARFDLAPAALVLAAALARQAARTATWSALLSTAVAVKFFPVFLYPSFLRDEPQLRRALLAAIPPLALAAGIVLVTGDEFGSAINYHTGRDLQIETLGATPFMLWNVLGPGDATSMIGRGGWNLVASGADYARALSIGLFFVSWIWLTIEGWRRRVPPLEIATAILAVMILLAPVLSPQFLFWVLPVSAAAYGLRLPNLLLIVAVLLTEEVLANYNGVSTLSDSFVLSVAARNTVLIAYVAAAIVYAFREREPEPSVAPT